MDRFILIIVCLNIFAATAGNAQDRITSLSLEEAITLATRQNFTLGAAQFEYQATRANLHTGGAVPACSTSLIRSEPIAKPRWSMCVPSGIIGRHSLSTRTRRRWFGGEIV
jgi:hypothetical protein